jgi:predicted DNA-binding transcriptional regulator AlpA
MAGAGLPGASRPPAAPELTEQPAPERYLGWAEVRPLFGGISRTTAWRGARDGWLPRPVRVSPGRNAWRSSDIAAWQAALDRRAVAQAGEPIQAPIPMAASRPPGRPRRHPLATRHWRTDPSEGLGG